MPALETILLLVTLVTPSLDVDPNMAYVVIDASVTDANRDQPNWIAFYRGVRGVHIPTGRYIVALRPGTYKINHIDFQQDYNLSDGTQLLKKNYKFELKTGKIYLLGHYEFTWISGTRYDLNMGNDYSLLKKACEIAPEIFNSFPVSTVDNTKELKLICTKSEHQ